MLLVESFKLCSRCLGSGVDNNQSPTEPPIPCVPCGASGKVNAGWIDIEALMDKCNDIMDKCNDIFEKVSE